MALGMKTVPKVPERYTNMMKQLVKETTDSVIPWRHVLPQDEFKNFFKNLIGETTAAFPNLPFDYYETAWTPATNVLNSLKTARIDTDKLNRYTDDLGRSVPGLETFRPKRSGFSYPVVYDRFSTRTGRLTVSDGPNILVLKKDCRDIIMSSWEGGSICYLDFRALEARIVLAENDVYSDADDLYGEIADKQFDGKIPRDTVKTAILAELYGISRTSLKARLGISDEKLNHFVESLEKYFGVATLKRRLKEEYERTGFIKNRFGRPLEVPGGQDNLLINTYAQSSGVDVSMIGFNSVLQNLGADGIRPLFVLHDAIILDVRPDKIKDVKSVDSVPVTGYRKNFPIKLEVV